LPCPCRVCSIASILPGRAGIAAAGGRKTIESRPIVIGRNVWIAAGATILGGMTVGDNAVVGAGAVVTRDVPPNTFLAGAPARVVRQLDADDDREADCGTCAPGAR